MILNIRQTKQILKKIPLIIESIELISSNLNVFSTYIEYKL